MLKQIYFILFLFLIVSCEEVEPTDNPNMNYPEDIIVQYKFDGDANDYSQYNLHGEIFGATLTTDRYGIDNKALYFDGIDDYVKVEYDEVLNIDTPFTFTAWINPEYLVHDIYADSYVIFAQSAPYDEIYSLNVNYRSFMCGHIGYQCYTPVNEWTMYAVTLDNDSVISFYRNDVRIARTTLTSIISALNGEYDGDLYIGKDANEFFQYFQGKIDDIIIFNRCLDKDEIVDLYNNEYF